MNLLVIHKRKACSVTVLALSLFLPLEFQFVDVEFEESLFNIVE